MTITNLAHHQTLALDHHGDCTLLGMAGDGTIYVEEIYGDGWLAQHAYAPDGTRITSVDEAGGTRPDIAPLSLPPDVQRSQPGWHSAALNFAGPRHRGMRESERVADLVHSLSVAERLALASQYVPDLPPHSLLGLAESFVLAEAALAPPRNYIVCRRIRFAYATSTICTDADNQPYDYDTFVVYWAHVYHRDQDEAGLLPLPESQLPGPTLLRPMDCMVRGDRLVVADGGDDRLPARLHVWRLERDPDTGQTTVSLPSSSTEA